MILVTGASGTVGSEVVKALGGRSTRVRAGYRTRPQNVPAGVESVPLDYERPETIRPALLGVDTLFLLSNAVDPERKVVDEAKRAGVKRIVKLSVIGAAEEGFTFARWHRAVEKYIAEILSRVLGRTIRYVLISPEQYRQAAVAAGTPEGYADALVDLNRYYLEGKAAVVTPAVRQLTGRDPIPFEQFARDHADKLR